MPASSNYTLAGGRYNGIGDLLQASVPVLFLSVPTQDTTYKLAVKELVPMFRESSDGLYARMSPH